MHHLNHAGASPISEATYQAITAHLKAEMTMGPYEAASANSSILTDLREEAGKLVGLPAANIAFTDSATRAWNTLVYSLAPMQGKRILVSEIEFGSSLSAIIDWSSRNGARVELIPVDGLHRVNVDALKSMLSGDVGLVAVTHSAANLPVLNDIEQIAETCAEHEVPVLLDVCQTVGLMRLPVIANPRVAWCATGRKWLRGPRGTGFLGVSKDWIGELNPPTIDLANSEVEAVASDSLNSLSVENTGKKFEIWEKSWANLAGFRNAIRETNAIGLESIYGRVIDRCNRLKSLLSGNAIDHLISGEAQESGIVGFRLTKVEAEKAQTLLDLHEINASIMSAWDTPLFFNNNNIEKILRISPHHFTEIKTIELAANVLNQHYGR